MSKATDYDALLVVSFGGPEGPADVDSFLDNVFRGLRVPPETKAEIAKRWSAVIERYGYGQSMASVEA